MESQLNSCNAVNESISKGYTKMKIKHIALSYNLTFIKVYWVGIKSVLSGNYILKAMIACEDRLQQPGLAYFWFWDIAPLTRQSSFKFILCRVYVGFIELWSVNYSLSYQQYNSYQQGCNKQVFPPYINHNLTTFIFAKRLILLSS